jgi:acetamidase/formamidase
MTGLDVVSYVPTPEELAWTFGGVGAVRTVKPGSVLEVWTEDCYAGQVKSPGDLVSEVCEFPFLNPQTGPFHVEGAHPGDTLAVHFVSIRPSRSYASSTTVPLFGALTSTHATATLQPPLPERVWMYDVDTTAWTVAFTPGTGDPVVLPMDPMHGTVGVAPGAFEVRSAIVPDAHGGNLDCPEMRAGVTAYFGVNVEGALLSLGDGHCRQGEGEACGTAVESAMDTVLAVDVVPGTPTPWPRIETDDHLMCLGSGKPLEDAYRVAHVDLVTWVAELCGLEQLDAYQLVSQTAESPMANVCNPNYTVVAKIAKRYLPGLTPVYGGAHGRLRETADAYRAEHG